MIKSLLFVLMAHMVGDYLFQSDYLAMNKGKDNYILLAHSILYTVGVMFVAYIMSIEISLYGLMILSVLHFPIDYIKARGITPKYLGSKNALILDQLIHYLTLLFVLSIWLVRKIFMDKLEKYLKEINYKLLIKREEHYKGYNNTIELTVEDEDIINLKSYLIQKGFYVYNIGNILVITKYRN